MTKDEAKELLTELRDDPEALEYLQQGNLRGLGIYLYSTRSSLHKNAYGVLEALEMAGVNLSDPYGEIIKGADLTVCYIYNLELGIQATPESIDAAFPITYVPENEEVQRSPRRNWGTPWILSRSDATEIAATLTDELGYTYEGDVSSKQEFKFSYLVHYCDIDVHGGKVPGYFDISK